MDIVIVLLILTCVSPLVDLQVLRSGKHFSTAGEGTWEWFLSGVYSDMIYKFVFGFERFSFSDALFPEADMVRLLRSTDMLHCQVGHELVHRAESFVASLFGVRQLFGLDPLTDELLFDGLPHVSEKGPCPVVSRHVHVHGAIAVQLGGGVVVGAGARNMAVLVSPAVHVPGNAKAHLAVDDIR